VIMLPLNVIRLREALASLDPRFDEDRDADTRVRSHRTA
jgi:hypothetical protein